MRRITLVLPGLLLSLFCRAQSPVSHTIIPAPNSVVPGTEAAFLPSSASGIVFENPDDERIANLFRDYLKATWALDLPVARNFIAAPKGLIRFTSAEYAGNNPEGYLLVVKPDQVTVSGKGAGLFYGLQSLLQLFPASGVPALPSITLRDEPRYKYRGMHLDVCRHFFPVSFVKKYIDLLAQYKLNTFHWHLTDDQGWRIEIKKYPKLTSVGGYRAQTLVGNYHDRVPQAFDGTPYGGFYTQDEIRDVVRYAAERFITVIPEIEMPGHSLAALSAYPELACNDRPGPFKSAETWGVFNDVYCPGKDSTFAFLENVLTEVMALFPSNYVHIGGDECPKVRWKTCSHCQRRIRDNRLKSEEELQSYFIRRIEKFINDHGKRIIGWDEILEGGIAPNATLMAWRSIAAGVTAAKQNHDVIMTPSSHLYLDHLQGKGDQEPLSIGGYSPLEKVYALDPTPASLPADKQKYVIGVQANLWTEYIATEAKVEYMLLPRLFALAEVAWTYPGNKNFADFSARRVAAHLARADHTSTLYRVPVAIGARDTTLYGSQFSLVLSPSVNGGTVYYTLDGYTPGETDARVSGPLQLSVPAGEKRTLKTVVITPGGRRSAVTTTLLNNEPPLPAKDTLLTRQGLNYHYVPGDFSFVKSIDTLAATERGTVQALNLQKFRLKTRTYGLVFSGYVSVPQDGLYQFTTSSDDGSALSIDGRTVVDNDGKHSAYELSGVVNLLKGYHQLEVRYFQAGGAGDLKVFMAPAGSPRRELALQQLFN